MHDIGLPVPSLIELNQEWLSILTGLEQHNGQTHIRPLEPDRLGEWFFLQRASGHASIGAKSVTVVQQYTSTLFDYGWQHAEVIMAEFLVRSVRDYTTHPQIIPILEPDRLINKGFFGAAVFGGVVQHFIECKCNPTEKDRFDKAPDTVV